MNMPPLSFAIYYDILPFSIFLILLWLWHRTDSRLDKALCNYTDNELYGLAIVQCENGKFEVAKKVYMEAFEGWCKLKEFDNEDSAKDFIFKEYIPKMRGKYPNLEYRKIVKEIVFSKEMIL